MSATQSKCLNFYSLTYKTETHHERMRERDTSRKEKRMRTLNSPKKSSCIEEINFSIIKLLAFSKSLFKVKEKYQIAYNFLQFKLMT